MSRSQVTGKEFVLRCVFNDVSNMNDNDMRFGTVEEYFNVPWIFQIQRNNGNLGIYLRCTNLKDQEMWSIFSELELKLVSVYSDTRDQKCKIDMCFGHDSGKFYSSYGWSEFISWNELETSFMEAGSITVEARVLINKSIGFYTPKLMDFDEKMMEYSDIVVLVNGQRFYLLKKFLAFHSTFFESLFLGGFYEAKLAEVPLYDIDVDDFQKFLEVLYGFPVINVIVPINKLTLQQSEMLNACAQYAQTGSQKLTREANYVITEIISLSGTQHGLCLHRSFPK